MENLHYTAWSETDKASFRDWLKGVLACHSVETVTVEFLKKDGTRRQMNCTLKESITPSYEKKTDRVANNDVCFVYDTDKNEWRSFRYDSILSVNFTL